MPYPEKIRTWDIEIYIRDTDQVYKIVLNRIADMGITNGYAPFPNPSLLFLCEKDLAVMKRGSKMPDQTAVHPSMLRPQHEVYQFFRNESNDNDWYSAMAARICFKDQNQAGFTGGTGSLPDHSLPAAVPCGERAQRGTVSGPSHTKGRSFMTHKKVAFIRTLNASRNQIAEVLAKHLGLEGYEFYSAGSDPAERIDQNAVRIMEQQFGIDMSGQHPRTVRDIPAPDIAISMGCGVRCPYIGRAFDADWGLEDPTGGPDAEYLAVIWKIQKHLERFLHC